MDNKWKYIESHYNYLLKDVYSEPHSKHHREAAWEVINEFCQGLQFESAVEFGCGTAPALDALKQMGKKTLGVTMKDEVIEHEVLRTDMHFSGLDDRSFDMVVSRHSLEHSPMPLFMLMEMYRISKKYSIVVVPTYNRRNICTWINHYSVLTKPMWEKLFIVASWKIIKYKVKKYYKNEYGYWDSEHRWLLEKL